MKERNRVGHLHHWFYRPHRQADSNEPSNRGYRYCRCGAVRVSHDIKASKAAQLARVKNYRKWGY